MGCLENLIGGEERTSNFATAGEGRQFGEDEAGIGVGGEAGLKGLEVEEFLRVEIGGKETGSGKAGGDKGFAHRGV